MPILFLVLLIGKMFQKNMMPYQIKLKQLAAHQQQRQKKILQKLQMQNQWLKKQMIN